MANRKPKLHALPDMSEEACAARQAAMARQFNELFTPILNVGAAGGVLYARWKEIMNETSFDHPINSQHISEINFLVEAVTNHIKGLQAVYNADMGF